VKAIKVENGQAQVVPELCIHCGTCVKECPQNAKTYKKDIDKVLHYIAQKEDMLISIAPSFAGYYGEWEGRRLPSALRQCGFSLISETAVGAYYTALFSKDIVEKDPNISHLLTACPAFVSFIEKYKPELIKNLVETDSPMILHAKLLRKKFGQLSKIVFAGPCIAKKAEAELPPNKGLLDAVLTFEELDTIFNFKKIDLTQCEESGFDEIPGQYARNFPIEGGLLQTGHFDTLVTSSKSIAVSGFDEISDLTDFIKTTSEICIAEPLFCRNGCINGPGITSKKTCFESRRKVLEFTEKQSEFPESICLKSEDFRSIFGSQKIVNKNRFTENELLNTLATFGKLSPEDELNCSACGYNSCRDKAIAVLQGKAEYEMCIPYMRRLAEAKNNIVIETSPNGIIVLNENLEIESINPAFKKMFSCNEMILKKKISYLIDPDPFERIATGTIDEIKKNIHYPNYNLICHQISYALRHEKKYIGIFIDITEFETGKGKLREIKNETILQTQELIEHQINMAQELARFLGENTAKGEMLMNKLIDAIKKE
jgi:iron only hydrogenase large subunit-like protein